MTDALPSAALDALRDGLAGALLAPGDPGYETAHTLWNGAVHERPGLVAHCTAVPDVVGAIRFAREHDLLTTVRGGGHGVGGQAARNGGLMIDLSALREVRVDPDMRTATVQGGALWSDFDRETAVFGLGSTGGQISTTGVAGLTLGGGLGWLMRSLGASVDNLLAAELVTADAAVVPVSRTENPDLFWALRGGGGNFGVATSMTFRLHPVAEVLGGTIFWPQEQAAAALARYQELAERAPRDLSLMTYFVPRLVAPFIPPELADTPMVAIAVCCTDPALWDGVLADLRGFGKPVGDSLAPMPYPQLQAMFDRTAPFGMKAYWRSCYLSDLGTDANDVIAQFAASASSPVSQILITHLGGALRDAPAEGTSFGHRDATHVLEIIAKWTDGGLDPHRSWADEFLAAMKPFSTGGAYVNFLGDEGWDRIASAYEPASLSRLADLKAEYDPDNFFCNNQNIPPADDKRV